MIFTSKGPRQSKKTILCPPVFPREEGKNRVSLPPKNLTWVHVDAHKSKPTSSRGDAAAGIERTMADWRMETKGRRRKETFFPPGERHLKRKSERTRCQLCGMVFLFLFFFSAPPLLPFFVFSLSLSLSLSPPRVCFGEEEKEGGSPYKKKLSKGGLFLPPSLPEFSYFGIAFCAYCTKS